MGLHITRTNQLFSSYFIVNKFFSQLCCLPGETHDAGCHLHLRPVWCRDLPTCRVNCFHAPAHVPRRRLQGQQVRRKTPSSNQRIKVYQIPGKTALIKPSLFLTSFNLLRAKQVWRQQIKLKEKTTYPYTVSKICVSVASFSLDYLRLFGIQVMA